MSSIDDQTKNKLAALMAELQPIIDSHLSQLTQKEIDYLLTNYRKYLKIDLERDLEQARESNLKNSPFDELLKDGFN